MNRDKQVCACLIGYSCPLLKRDEDIIIPRHYNLDPKLIGHYSAELFPYFKNYILFLYSPISDSSGIMTTLTVFRSNCPALAAFSSPSFISIGCMSSLLTLEPEISRKSLGELPPSCPFRKVSL